MEWIEVIKPGLWTTVQDLGRPGYRTYGVPTGGAMDPVAHKLANLLVGNPPEAATLEMALTGPHLRFLSDGVIAIAGADMQPNLQGRVVSLWRTIRVERGDELRFGSARNGRWGYVAVRGGIQVEPVMGSRSTFVRGGFGGFKGRPLRKGDVISGLKREADGGMTAGKAGAMAAVANRILPPRYRPDYDEDRPVRFVLGPEWDAFPEEALARFVSSEYSVTTSSDRMGYRLVGPKLTHRRSTVGANIKSDHIIPGCIQVPGDGQPIVLMSDCQVTGGYTRIGTVISVDLPVLAQKKPGDTVRFAQVRIEEAQALWKEQENWLSLLAVNN